MSFVTTHPEALTAAAVQLQGIGSAMVAENAAAAAPTTGVVPAAADEVSALQATQFAAYGNLYQQISAQATAMHEMFVHTLRASADSYGVTEAANSVAAAPSGAGLTGAGLTGAGLTGAGLTSLGAGDPSFGVAGALSNSGVLAAMQGGTIGSAASEFTGLGKGFISEPSGFVRALGGLSDAVLTSTAAPASPAAAAAVSVSAGMGQASSVGGLSVPPSWAGEVAPTPSATHTALAGTGWTANAPHSGPVTTMPAGMPAVASAGRGGSRFGTPRYGVKHTVMRRPAVG